MFAQLLGLNDPLTEKIRDAGQPVHKFVPFGPITVVLPYLMRRLEENADLTRHL